MSLQLDSGHESSSFMPGKKENRPVRLLVIEEHPAVRQALAQRLSSSARVAQAWTADSLREEDWPLTGWPDVVLLGVGSRGSRDLAGALALVRRLVARGTAVIVLSSFADDLEKELFLQAGAKRYLLKDINSEHLLAEIETAVFNS
ncbi:MAG: response regulator [Chloroflexi bacterium]|nr:MAG: response regulator [Chloroflexota bacterium]